MQHNICEPPEKNIFNDHKPDKGNQLKRAT